MTRRIVGSLCELAGLALISFVLWTISPILAGICAGLALVLVGVAIEGPTARRARRGVEQ